MILPNVIVNTILSYADTVKLLQIHKKVQLCNEMRRYSRQIKIFNGITQATHQQRLWARLLFLCYCPDPNDSDKPNEKDIIKYPSIN